MRFHPLNEHPDRFIPILIRRDMETYLKVNGVVQYGIKERRSEFVISWYTGRHYLGREEHWVSWTEIPPESHSNWVPAGGMIPSKGLPVLVIVPQPIVMMTLIIEPGIHFGSFNNDTWRVFQRSKGARITENDQLTTDRCWIDVGKKPISSWLPLPDELELNVKLRRVGA